MGVEAMTPKITVSIVESTLASIDIAGMMVVVISIFISLSRLDRSRWLEGKHSMLQRTDWRGWSVASNLSIAQRSRRRRSWGGEFLEGRAQKWWKYTSQCCCMTTVWLHGPIFVKLLWRIFSWSLLGKIYWALGFKARKHDCWWVSA